jgi:WD40 repeat protein
MAFLSDDQLVSVSVTGEVKLWEWKTGKATDLPHQTPAYCAAFSSDGKRLAISGADGNVRVLALPEGKIVMTLMSAGHVRCLALSACGEYLATAGDPRRPDELKVWLIGREPELYTLRGHRGAVQCMSFSPDGRLLASGGNDGFVMIWDPTPSRELVEIPNGVLPSTKHTTDVASPDGRFRAEVRDREIHLIPLDRAAESLVLRHGSQVACIAFSPDGRRLASVERSRQITLWDVQTGFKALTISTGSIEVRSLEFTSNGNQLRGRVSGSENKMMVLDGTPLERPDERGARAK